MSERHSTAQPWHGVRRILANAGSWSMAGLCAAVCATVVELLVVAVFSPIEWGQPGGPLAIALTVVATMVPTGLVLAWLVGLLCWAAADLGSPRASLEAMTRWLDGPAEDDRPQRIAVLLLGGPILAGAWGLATACVGFAGSPFAMSWYNSSLAAAVALGSAALVWAFGRAARRLLASVVGRALARFDPPHRGRVTARRVLWAMATLHVVVAVAVAVVFVRKGLEATQIAQWVTLAAALLGLATSPRWSSIARRLPHNRLFGAGAVSLLAASTFAGLTWAGDTQAGRFFIARNAALSGPMARVARWATDWDADGYSSLLGGGDCAPGDPARHPAAREVLDNGVDENCVAGDLTADDVVPPPEPRFVETGDTCGGATCDILLITIDTLRWDRVGAYGAAGGLTPAIDRLAAESVRFDRAYCLGPGTILTVPQMFAVRHDSQLELDLAKADTLGPRPLTRRNVLFPQALARAGYATSAVVGHHYLESLRHGFLNFDNPKDAWADPSSVTSPEITERAKARYDKLRVADRPFFMWVHYYDPHHDYFAHASEAYPAGSASARRAVVDAQSDAARYDEEVRFTDAWVGALLDHIAQHPGQRPLIVALTADHGEALGDHGIRYHNRGLYDEICHVPWLLRVPGIGPRSIATPVSLHDLGPTLLNLARGKPSDGLEGQSLLGMLTAADPVASPWGRPIFHQAVYVQAGVSHALFGVTIESWRLFWDRLNGTIELYDVESDPRETRNVLAEHPDVGQQLLKAIEGFLYRVEPHR